MMSAHPRPFLVRTRVQQKLHHRQGTATGFRGGSRVPFRKKKGRRTFLPRPNEVVQGSPRAPPAKTQTKRQAPGPADASSPQVPK
eukprot:6211999-Lingulodinium_polyedra.AAC.1